MNIYPRIFTRRDGSEADLKEGTSQFEFYMACKALNKCEDSGDTSWMRTGLGFLANLLAKDPSNLEWQELLEQYISAERKLERLLPAIGSASYAFEGVRAYLWHKDGKLVEAINLLQETVATKTSAKYFETWILDWLEPAGVIESLPPEFVISTLSFENSRFPERNYLAVAELQALQRWSAICERYCGSAEHQIAEAGFSNLALHIRCNLLCKSGSFEKAEALVRPSLGDFEPPVDTARANDVTILGRILQLKGEITSAEKLFDLALELNPQDILPARIAADGHYYAERWELALKWYDRLERAGTEKPDLDWAKASKAFCKWVLEEEGILELESQYSRELETMGGSGNSRAHKLWYRVFGAPWARTENIARLCNKIFERTWEEKITDDQFEITTILEQPSNFLAWRLQMASLDLDHVKLRVTFTEIPQPDPRIPLVPDLPYQLWTYEGTEAKANMHTPSSIVVDEITKIASLVYDEKMHWALTGQAAERLGPERIRDILAIMVDPPPVPGGRRATDWLLRIQLAAAEIAAQVDTGWEGSIRKDAMLSLLFGPRDWTTEAAIKALAQLGRFYPTLAYDIHQAFVVLLKQIPNVPDYYCWVETLFAYWLMLQHLTPAEREEVDHCWKFAASLAPKRT